MSWEMTEAAKREETSNLSLSLSLSLSLCLSLSLSVSLSNAVLFLAGCMVCIACEMK